MSARARFGSSRLVALVVVVVLAVGAGAGLAAAATQRGLVHSTFIGGNEDDWAWAVDIGPDGSAYVAGQASEGLTTTPGVVQPGFGGRDPARCDSPCTDAFVARYAPDGRAIWITYLGGSGRDRALDLDVDADGNAYITGNTMSIDFPLKNPIHAEWTGGHAYGDAFVAKLAPDGRSLLYSTYLGGNSGLGDAGFGITVGADGRATIAGYTDSYNFPTTDGAYKETCVQQPSFACAANGFVARLAPDGTKLEWSTLFGSEPSDISDGLDDVRDLAIASDGSIVIVGFTRAQNFPATPGAFDRTFNGWAEGYVAKLASDGSALKWATYLGGEYVDDMQAVVLDDQDRPMVAGGTESIDFPTTAGAHDPYCNGYADVPCHPYGDAFFTVLSADGSRLDHSTFLGGRMYETGTDIARDAAGNVWITGGSASIDFETKNPVQAQYAGEGCFWAPCYDAFVRQLLAGTWQIGYSTLLGGFDEDHGTAITVRGDSIAFVGYTASEGFPLRNAADTTCGPTAEADCGPNEWGVTLGDAFAARLGPVAADVDPPQGQIAIEGGAAYARDRAVSLSVPATDGGSGLTHVRLSNDGSTWTTRSYSPTQEWTLASGDGRKTVHAQWRDGAGNWSATKSDTIVLDSVAPTATGAVRSFAAGGSLASGAIPVRLAWTGSDATSGVARYQLRQQTDGGAWTTISSSLTATSLTRYLAPGYTYRFAVRAYDKAGNVGAFAYGSTFTLAGYQQTSSAFRYTGTWRTGTSTSYWGGSAAYSANTGATASFTATGRSFALIASRGPTRGKATIYVNGVYRTTIDLYASTRLHQRVVWTGNWSTSATRTITVRVSGTPGRPTVIVDGFAVAR